LAPIRASDNKCPKDVVKLIIDLIRMNENSKNKYSDHHYRAALIDALITTVDSKGKSISSQEVRLVIEEIVLRLNLEKILPTYKYVVTISCLKGLRKLQKLGHLPENVEIFKEYSILGNFDDVRMVAYDLIIDYLSVNNEDEAIFDYLFSTIENEDESMTIRQYIIESLTKTPPFNEQQHLNCCLNNEQLVHRLWTLMSASNRLRSHFVELYYALYGISKPKCLKQVFILINRLITNKNKTIFFNHFPF
jgi:transcription initiation factor TFIID subunit 2